MKLKELAEKIPMQITRIGFNRETEQTSFVITINNQNFDYHCGLFASVSKEDIKKLEASYGRPTHGYDFKKVLNTIREGRAKASKNWGTWAQKVWDDLSSVCKPDKAGVLYSLKLDSEGLEDGFDEWASNLGYDTDSRKAESIFNACKESARKLRLALGKELFAELLNCDTEGF